MSDRKLLVYEICEDFVVAHDPDDAWAVWSEHTGERRDDYEGNFYPIPVTRDLDIKMDDGSGTIVKSTEQWAACNGRGFLASRNY